VQAEPRPREQRTEGDLHERQRQLEGQHADADTGDGHREQENQDGENNFHLAGP